MTVPRSLHKTLGLLEYFTFGFGSMVGVGWLVLMDDWLGRGGPGGAMLGFLLGGALLLPIARTYARLVRDVPDAGAEIAYTERVFPPFLSFATGWVMVPPPTARLGTPAGNTQLWGIDLKLATPSTVAVAAAPSPAK